MKRKVFSLLLSLLCALCFLNCATKTQTAEGAEPEYVPLVDGLHGEDFLDKINDALISIGSPGLDGGKTSSKWDTPDQRNGEFYILLPKGTYAFIWIKNNDVYKVGTVYNVGDAEAKKEAVDFIMASYIVTGLTYDEGKTLLNMMQPLNNVKNMVGSQGTVTRLGRVVRTTRFVDDEHPERENMMMFTIRP